MPLELWIPIVGLLCFAFGFAAGRGATPVHKQSKESPLSQLPREAGTDAMQQVERLLRDGHKIEAIKAYREATHLGLKDAKDFVDRFERQLRL